jgi:tetratricopeptide (TPR) repeat protein
MKQAEKRWRASAAYQLGVHWQQVGDYVRADAAYADVLKHRPRQTAALYNRAVIQIRLERYSDARATLTELAAQFGLPKDDVAWSKADVAKRWKDAAFPIAYSRALAIHYDALGDATTAANWSQALAVRLLPRALPKRPWYRVWGPSRSQTDRTTMLLPALMLHAGLLIAEEIKATGGGGGPEFNAAVAGVLKPAPEVDARELATKLESRTGVAAAIEAYVRRTAGDDARAHYNLACYTARLADHLPDRVGAFGERARLCERALIEAEQAFRDPSLVPWAREDPSLSGMKDDPEWVPLLARYEEARPPAPAEQPPEPEAPTEQAAASVEPTHVEDERLPAAKSGRFEGGEDDERALIAEQGALLIAGVSVHAGSERGVRAAERLLALAPKAGLLARDRFHDEIGAAVAGLRDPVTVYLRPGGRNALAVLPLRIAECFSAEGVSDFVVAEIEPGFEGGPLRPGAEITHWDGEPIEHVVSALAERQAARSEEGRRARAVACLTHWPLAVLGSKKGTVLIRFRVEQTDHSVAVDWKRRRAPVPGGAPSGKELDRTTGRAVDELLEAIRRSSPDHPETVSTAVRESGPKPFAHLCVHTFDVRNVDRFIEQVRDRLEALPQDGLVLDVRGNPGGSIVAAERMLQLISPRRVVPTALQLASTRLTRALVEAADAPFGAWRESMDAEGGFSDGFPLVSDHEEEPGQVYHGPVVLLIDALCSGATDFLIAGFARNELGPILSTAGDPGVVAHNSWSDAQIGAFVPGSGLRRLQRGASFRVSIRRGLRGAQPLDGRRFIPNDVHRTTRADVLENGADVLREAGGMLEGLPVRVLSVTAHDVSADRIELELQTRGLTRLDAYFGGRPAWSGDVQDGAHTIELDNPGEGPGTLALEGFDQDVPAARRRVDLSD